MDTKQYFEKYFFKEKPQIQEQAYFKYAVDAWKNGTVWSEFIKYANSMTNEEYERFEIDYRWANNSSFHILPILWKKKEFWTRQKYSLLSYVSNPNEKDELFPNAHKEYQKAVKKYLDEGLVITAKPNTVIKKLTRAYKFDELYSPAWLHKIVYAGNCCVEQLVQFFPLSPKQIGVETGEDMDIHKIYIKIPDIGENKKMLKQAMSFFGYTLGNEQPDECINCLSDAPWIIITFVPDFQEYITERVLKENNYMFHISPTRFKEKILKRGLCPYSKNNEWKYQPRVYMILEYRFSIPMGKKVEFNIKSAVELAKLLHDAKPIEQKKWTEYTIYKIDISKIRSDVRLSYDQDYYPLGVFTTENINPEALEVFYEFDINKQNEND